MSDGHDTRAHDKDVDSSGSSPSLRPAYQPQGHPNKTRHASNAGVSAAHAILDLGRLRPRRSTGVTNGYAIKAQAMRTLAQTPAQLPADVENRSDSGIAAGA